MSENEEVSMQSQTPTPQPLELTPAARQSLTGERQQAAQEHLLALDQAVREEPTDTEPLDDQQFECDCGQCPDCINQELLELSEERAVCEECGCFLNFCYCDSTEEDYQDQDELDELGGEA